MMFSKKGQGLSLNVIIIAALALIVLVVLVVVFTGRIGIFEQGVGQEGNAQLIKLKIGYGDCHPTATEADAFVKSYDAAESVEAKDGAQNDFSQKISTCKSLSSDKATCEAGGCAWK